MMDEQVEYDQEALQVMKDLLMKREEEIKVLEAELKTYRERYGQITRLGSDECEVGADDDYQEMKSQSFSSVSEKSDCGSTSGGDHNGKNENKESGKRNLDESSLDFEGERSFLFGLLANLEKKFNESSDGGIIPAKSNSDVVKCEAEDIGLKNRAVLTREMSLLKERLRAIEADSGFLKHVAMTLHRGSEGEGTKLLTEIALHLQKLRQYSKKPSEDMDA